MDGTSRVTGDCHARFCERLGVKFPGATRRRGREASPYPDLRLDRRFRTDRGKTKGPSCSTTEPRV
jgi:hypothetical protein